MPANYYPKPMTGPPGRGAPPMRGAPETPPPAEKDKQKEPQTTLVPASIFGGETPQPGDTITGKVIRAYEDELEVELQCQHEGNPEKYKKPSMMPSADDELDAMDLPKE